MQTIYPNSILLVFGYRFSYFYFLPTKSSPLELVLTLAHLMIICQDEVK